MPIRLYSELSNKPIGLRVRKLRGSNYRAGEHAFRFALSRTLASSVEPSVTAVGSRTLPEQVGFLRRYAR